MLVYIAGSGAMGSTIGYHIMKNTDNEVILLDSWKDHINKINKDGLRVSGKETDKIEIEAMEAKDAKREADLIVVMSKSMALKQTMESIGHLIGQKTQVLCLLNGIGHEKILREFVDLDQINIGVTVWSAKLEGPGHVNITGIGTIDCKNLGGDDSKGRLVSKTLDEAGLNSKYDEDVLYPIWRKLMVNATMNSMSTILECKIGEFFDTKSHKNIIEELVGELSKVAQACGVKLDKNDMVDYIYKTSENSKDHYPSMYQDLIERNRKTEIDFINGAVVEEGRKHDIDCPYNKIITNLIHTKEEIRGAK